MAGGEFSYWVWREEVLLMLGGGAIHFEYAVKVAVLFGYVVKAAKGRGGDEVRLQNATAIWRIHE